MSIYIYTHDQINIDKGAANGLLKQSTLLWGGNAIQTVQATRNTPRNPVQAVGYLGPVDYSRGTVTSDVTIDTILVQDCDAVATSGGTLSSASRYAAKSLDLNQEQYALTSFAMSAAAGSPVTCNYGWITAGLASYLLNKAQPAISDGTQVMVILGDQDAGLALAATWSGSAPASSNITVLNADGSGTTTVTDSGLPAGVQSLNVSANINRDQVLDVRTSRPIQFVTTYPIRITCDMEVYQLPGTSAPNTTAPVWNQLTALELKSRDNVSGSPKTYMKVIGLAKQTEGESINVGRYLAYTVNFEATEIYFPITAC